MPAGAPKVETVAYLQSGLDAESLLNLVRLRSSTAKPHQAMSSKMQRGISVLTSRYGLEIRAASSADAPGLASLLAEAGQLIDARELAERARALRAATGAILIALRWGPPSGLVELHWYHTLKAARPVAQITTLLVGVEERRLGIGRLLVKAAAQAARTAGCGSLHISVAPDATGLHEFCRATGFADTGSLYARSLRKQA